MSFKLLEIGKLYHVKRKWETDKDAFIMPDDFIILLAIEHVKLTSVLTWLIADGRIIPDTWAFSSLEMNTWFIDRYMHVD